MDAGSIPAASTINLPHRREAARRHLAVAEAHHLAKVAHHQDDPHGEALLVPGEGGGNRHRHALARGRRELAFDLAQTPG